MTTSTLNPDSPDTTATAVIDPAATAQLPDTQLPAAPAVPAAEQPYAAPQNAAAPMPQQSAFPPVRPTNVLGIVTLVLGVLGFAIVPVITGHIALSQIKRTGDDGRSITIAGLVLGYVGLAGYLIAALFFFGALFLAAVGAIGSYR
jgi:hypothetical protein